MKYSTDCTLTGVPSGKPIPLPTINNLVEKIEVILDYEFESPSLCRDALVVSKKQAYLAGLPPIPDFGGQDILAAAAKKSGIASLFKASKEGNVVSDEQLAVTVKALLGAVMEDIQDDNYVLQAAYNLGLEVVEEYVEVVKEVSTAPIVELLSKGTSGFAQSMPSVSVVQSLI